MILLIGGCPETGPQGPQRINMPPIVEFVNIPVEGARFQSDTLIHWSGTDVDGFITEFRYAVVEKELVDARGGPETFLEVTPDSALGWVVITVELENPGTQEKIKMSADISDPVRKYIASYIFLQAIDNLGAKSVVVYKMFYKNNHFPDTQLNINAIDEPYVNAKSAGGVLQGVNVTWSGTDPIDYPLNPPAFEYRWKCFGPYDTTEMAYVNKTYIESIFVDIYGDFYYKGGHYPVPGEPDTMIDTTIIPPDTIITVDTTWLKVDTLRRGNPYGSWQECMFIDSISSNLLRPLDSSWNPLSQSPWVLDQNINLYDVYRRSIFPGDTTSLYYFLFWVQARDDSKVPDKIPAFGWTSVIDPKYEREVIIVDFTSYSFSNSGLWNYPKFPRADSTIMSSPPTSYPSDLIPLVAKVLGGMVREWAGQNNIFDIEKLLKDVPYDLPNEERLYYRYEKWHATQDYYPINALVSPGLAEAGIGCITLRDILKHKIIILVKDMVSDLRALPMTSPEMSAVIGGLNAGLSCWAMVRDPFPVGSFAQADWDVGCSDRETHPYYQQYFGVIGYKHQGWQSMINFPDMTRDSMIATRIEDFKGANIEPAFTGNVPTYLPIDTLFLETRYQWEPGPAGYYRYPYRCASTGEAYLKALPEVGIVVRLKPIFNPSATVPMYLYESPYGGAGPFFGFKCDRHYGILCTSNGGVVALRYETELFRTAHFSFTLLPIQADSAQAVFNEMMDWLSDQPYIQTGKMAYGRGDRVDVGKLRSISRELLEEKRQRQLEHLKKVADVKGR
jgi:hypothetical protein